MGHSHGLCSFVQYSYGPTDLESRATEALLLCKILYTHVCGHACRHARRDVCRHACKTCVGPHKPSCSATFFTDMRLDMHWDMCLDARLDTRPDMCGSSFSAEYTWPLTKITQCIVDPRELIRVQSTRDQRRVRE